ncbi:hypothetical protein V5F59_24370 [Xanthobacter autotrophicus DSM 431]
MSIGSRAANVAEAHVAKEAVFPFQRSPKAVRGDLRVTFGIGDDAGAANAMPFHDAAAEKCQRIRKRIRWSGGISSDEQEARRACLFDQRMRWIVQIVGGSQAAGRNDRYGFESAATNDMRRIDALSMVLIS